MTDVDATEEAPETESEMIRRHAFERDIMNGSKMHPSLAANMAVSMRAFFRFSSEAENRRPEIKGKRLRILAVHGINYSDNDPVAELWESILCDMGVNCRVEDVRWGSTGMISGDVAAFARPSFRAKVVAKVDGALEAFAAGGPGVVLSHSMGTVLALHSERRVQTGLPMVCMASPLSNIGIVGALKAVGFGGSPPGRPMHFWNNDDPIPGGTASRQPNYFDATRIAVPDPEALKINADSEHDVRLYLGHPLVLDGIVKAAAG